MFSKLIAFISQKPAVNQPSISRNDGYSEFNAKIVCKFQADIERLENPNYEALRAALLKSRELSAQGFKLSAVGLTAIYNDLDQANIWN